MLFFRCHAVTSSSSSVANPHRIVRDYVLLPVKNQSDTCTPFLMIASEVRRFCTEHRVLSMFWRGWLLAVYVAGRGQAAVVCLTVDNAAQEATVAGREDGHPLCAANESPGRVSISLVGGRTARFYRTVHL